MHVVAKVVEVQKSLPEEGAFKCLLPVPRNIWETRWSLLCLWSAGGVNVILQCDVFGPSPDYKFRIIV